jgi:hypothetical protein
MLHLFSFDSPQIFINYLAFKEKRVKSLSFLLFDAIRKASLVS